MGTTRLLDKSYRTYNGYVIKTSVFQKNTSALCDKKVQVQIFDQPGRLAQLFGLKKKGSCYRFFTEVASNGTVEKNATELEERAEQVIDNRLDVSL